MINLKQYLKNKGFEPKSYEKTIILRHGATRKSYQIALEKGLLTEYTGFQNTEKNHGIFDKKVKYIVELLPNGMDIGKLNKVYVVNKSYIINKPKHIEELAKKYPIAFDLKEYNERIYYDLEDLIVDNNNTLFNFPGCRSWVRNWESSTNITTL